jgi:hypothetical protein
MPLKAGDEVRTDDGQEGKLMLLNKDGGVFSIPPEQTAKINVAVVCLDHGLRNPSAPPPPPPMPPPPSPPPPMAHQCSSKSITKCAGRALTAIISLN